jgi:hypothetical protein
VSWTDWLGCGDGATALHTFREFEELRAYIMEAGLESFEQWREWCRDHRPSDIPSHPDRTYTDEGYESMLDWLGYDKQT